MTHVSPTVFNFCSGCGQQLKTSDAFCPCCGAETFDQSRVSLSKHSKDRRPGRRGDDDEHQDDPFYLL